MKELEERVAALERATTLYRLGFGIIALCITGLVISGAGSQVQDKVQAKAFEVVDDSGAVLATMRAEQGDGFIANYHKDGKILARIFATGSENGAITTYNPSGKENVVITDDLGGGGSILVDNAKGADALKLHTNGVDAGDITILNMEGKMAERLTVNGKQAGSLSIYNADGQMITDLTSTGSGAGRPLAQRIGREPPNQAWAHHPRRRNHNDLQWHGQKDRRVGSRFGWRWHVHHLRRA